MFKNSLICCLLFFASALMGMAGTPGKPDTITKNPFDNSKFIEVDSVVFHYRIWNDNVVHPRGNVLFVHGFCGSTYCWRKNWDPLIRAGYRVVAVDLPGFGYSERDETINQSQSNRARLLWDLLTQICPKDTLGWNIVGHSMGGGTVEAMALMQPARTRSLTIVDGMVFLKNENLKGAFITTSRWKDFKKLYVNYAEKSILKTSRLTRLLKNAYGYVPDPAVVEEYIKPLRIDGTAETIISIFSNADEICKLNASGLKTIPTMVVWGEDDGTISVRQGKKLKRHIPEIDLVIIPGARHMPMETNADVFNIFLMDLLGKTN
jgi:pimeloyl-ACP methyl ester carboxylesterase